MILLLLVLVIVTSVVVWLVFLMFNPDIVFSKEHLYERIWGVDALGDLKTVAAHINHLHEKIEEDLQNLQCIQTVWGAGYRFSLQ